MHKQKSAQLVVLARAVCITDLVIEHVPAKRVISQGLWVSFEELWRDRKCQDSASPGTNTTVALCRFLYHFGQLDIIYVGPAVAASTVGLKWCLGR